MASYYLTVDDGHLVLRDPQDKLRRYPGNAAGARRLAADLHRLKPELLLCGSSVDFPEESGAEDLDYRQLLAIYTADVAGRTEEVGRSKIYKFELLTTRARIKAGKGELRYTDPVTAQAFAAKLLDAGLVVTLDGARLSHLNGQVVTGAE